MTGVTSFNLSQDSLAIPSPSQLRAELPASADAQQCVASSRSAIRQTIRRTSERLLVIVGPCSIHDPEAALEYARLLLPLRVQLRDELEIVMRVYLEKPRTRNGWKGLITDPGLDGECNIVQGLRDARKLLVALTGMGMAVATEFLSPTAAHYLSDMVSWGAIGARTTESQIHRELASGLPCPIGFKNSTDGNVKIAVDAIHAASMPHHFVGVTEHGEFSRIVTQGNPDCHIVLRGGLRPNYDAPSVSTASSALVANGLLPRVVIDASHGNSDKNHLNQIKVCDVINEQISEGEERIVGAMIESNIVAGRQDHGQAAKLVFGQSITDACLGWTETVPLLEKLGRSVASRRRVLQSLSRAHRQGSAFATHSQQ